MKKILAILTLMIITAFLASCNDNKEGSKGEEANENAQVEAAEQATSDNDKKTISNEKNPATTKVIKSVKSDLSGSTSINKTEDQVVKDFENELDGLFKLLEGNEK